MSGSGRMAVLAGVFRFVLFLVAGAVALLAVAVVGVVPAVVVAFLRQDDSALGMRQRDAEGPRSRPEPVNREGRGSEVNHQGRQSAGQEARR